MSAGTSPLAVTVNQHGAVYVGDVTTGNVIGWVREAGCENENCLRAIAEGRPWHATPRSASSAKYPTLPAYNYSPPSEYPTLAVYHYSTREAAVAELIEAAGIVAHAPLELVDLEVPA